MFSERLREARKAKHYSQAEVSRLLGVTQQAVGKWETGRSTPDPQTVARLAEILDTTADMLLGLQSNADAHGAVGQRAFSQYTQCPIPVVGTVRAGYDALAFEEDYGTEYASVKDPQNYFYLVVKGDSMEPRISDGDLALIHRQNTLDNGDLGEFFDSRFHPWHLPAGYSWTRDGLLLACLCTGSCMEGRRMMWIIMIGIITVVGGIGLWLTRKHS